MSTERKSSVKRKQTVPRCSRKMREGLSQRNFRVSSMLAPAMARTSLGRRASSSSLASPLW